MKGEKDGLIQSVDRAIIILEELGKEANGCGITKLSNITGLPKSTVHRLLATLMNRGYVEKNLDTDEYQLGIRILSLSTNVLERMDIRKIAKPYITKLSESTGEVVHIGIMDQGEVVYIDKEESHHGTIRMYSQIGKRAPMYCTGLGKVLLSGLDDYALDQVMLGKKMIKITENTITNMKDLKEELKRIRKNGYAIDETEHERDIRCVAAPIYNMNGKVTAAISIAGPTIYVTKDRLPMLIDEILKTAKEISYQLGYVNE